MPFHFKFLFVENVRSLLQSLASSAYISDPETYEKQKLKAIFSQQGMTFTCPRLVKSYFRFSHVSLISFFLSLTLFFFLLSFCLSVKSISSLQDVFLRSWLQQYATFSKWLVSLSLQQELSSCITNSLFKRNSVVISFQNVTKSTNCLTYLDDDLRKAKYWIIFSVLFFRNKQLKRGLGKFEYSCKKNQQ